jgi:hypothetical protein
MSYGTDHQNQCLENLGDLADASKTGPLNMTEHTCLKQNAPFWNEALETMDPSEREETIILPKLQAQLQYAYQNSPFYRNKWDSAGVAPEDVQSLADFEEFPFVTKAEIREDQLKHPPFGSNLCISKGEIASVHGTSGTTGKPTAFGISRGTWNVSAKPTPESCGASACGPMTPFLSDPFSASTWGAGGPLPVFEGSVRPPFPLAPACPVRPKGPSNGFRKSNPPFFTAPLPTVFIWPKKRGDWVWIPARILISGSFFSPGSRVPACPPPKTD